MVKSDKRSNNYKKKNKQKNRTAWSFNFTFSYTDDVLSLNNARFCDFVDRIYPIEVEIKDNVCFIPWPTPRIWQWGRLRTKLYDKRDYFNFSIVNFPFICSNIPTPPAYGVYISQLIRYSRAFGSYYDFFDRGFMLRRKVLPQGFLVVMLKSSLRKFAVAILTWLTVTEYLCHKWPRICSIFPLVFIWLHIIRLYKNV